MSTETDLTTVIAPEASPVAVAQAEIVQESAPAETSEPAPAESVAVAETSPAIEEQKDATPAAEAEAETPAEPIYSGVLSKCGGALSIWRKRFFIFKSEATSAEQLMRLAKKAHAKKNADETFAVLAAATIRGDGLLFYFESDAQTETPLGVIALSDITEVKSTASPAFGFTLVVGKREYALGASTDAERQGWLKAIEEKRAEAATLADLSDNESFKTAFAAFKASYTPKDLKLKRKLFGKKATKVAETTTSEESSADETPAAIEAPKGEVTEEVAPVVEVAEKEEAVVAEAVKVEAPETVAEVPAIEEEVQESPKVNFFARLFACGCRADHAIVDVIEQVEQEKIEAVQEVEKVEEKPTVEEESVQEQPTEEKTEEPVAPVEEIAAEATDDTPKDDASTSAKSNKLERQFDISFNLLNK